MDIIKNVYYTQARNCKLCIQIGTMAFIFGHKNGFGIRIELFTPVHIFRIS